MNQAEVTEQSCSGAEQAAPAIRLSGVSKTFRTGGGPLEVLKDINLTVAPHMIVGLIGASGSGKSTLLNIIAGLLKPDHGQVCICGAAAEEFNDWCAVSYMFQDDRLLPWRTALRNVEFALEAGSMAQEERTRRAREVLQLVELAGFAEAFPYQLSGGMRSRVALARSLVTEPRILLMDEPFSRLDAQTRESMHEELLRVHQLKQMTVVFVTHDVSEAVLLADQVAVMAPRPGTIREVIDIGLSRPRNVTEPEVTRYMQRLRALI
ncbi:MAG: NitT/TauT family transport system ATP-binding protein [Candidatus Binatota bacterium]|jgi:ABC-type nitrate/sulfonate/bicarbonate transport system ATPase subunit|nr:NitT/TauT family transport system ATP-binding protein [Candidatus Binatota bacterium]